MTRTGSRIAMILLALYAAGSAHAQDPVGDAIKAKAKEFFESSVELELQGGVFRIITVNPRNPNILIDLCQAMESFALSIGAEMFDNGLGKKDVTLKVTLRLTIEGKKSKGKRQLTLQISVGETRGTNANNPNSFTRAQDGTGLTLVGGGDKPDQILMAVAGRGSATTIELNGGNGGVANVFTTEKRVITIAVGGNGGTSNHDQAVVGIGGDGTSEASNHAHAIAIGGRSGHTFGKGGHPPTSGNATAICSGHGRADACGGTGGDAGPGDAETNTEPGTGGTGGKATAKINFPGKVNKGVLTGPVAFARGGKGGDGGRGKNATETTAAGTGGKGGTSGDSQSIGDVNFVDLDPVAVQGGTGGKGGTGNPPGNGGPGGTGGKAFKNSTEVDQGPVGETGPQGDLAQ